MDQMIEEITNMQMLMSCDGSLSPQEIVITALHSLNIQHKLQCIDDKNDNIEFPVGWREQPDGSFTFRYKNTARGSIVKFKMTT